MAAEVAMSTRTDSRQEWERAEIARSSVEASLTADDGLRDAKEFSTGVPVELIDEIVIARNLPAASIQIMQRVSG